MAMARGAIIVLLVGCMGWGLELAAAELGVNWGTISSDPLPNSIVVQMLQDNSIVKVKLFDANSDVISSMRGTNLQVMVAITNDELASIAGTADAAAAWVTQNVTAHLGSGGVNITSVAVGNEPFLNGYNGRFIDVTLPALKNVQAALAAAGLGSTVKAVVPCNADVLSNSAVPSEQTFRADLEPLMLQIVAALDSTSSPFVINFYPFLSLVLSSGFPFDYAFFNPQYPNPVVDGSKLYYNVFDASYDGLVSALTKAGYPNMLISVGEIGWPTDGAVYANITLAQQFNQQLVNHLQSGAGTPARSGKLEAYVFSLLDENAKSTLPGNFERHWGVFNFDGSVKYPLDLTGGVSANGAQTQLVGAKNVPYFPKQWCILNPSVTDLTTLPANLDYACSRADCTPLYEGGSCGGMTLQQNASYAFNTYYQFNSQLPVACDFQGLAQVVTTDPSVGTCTFIIGVNPAASSPGTPPPPGSPSDGSAAPTALLDFKQLKTLLLLPVAAFAAAAILGSSFLSS